MTHDIVNTSAPPKRSKLWLVLAVALSSTAGAAYLGLQQMDRKASVAPVQRAAIKPPSGQAIAPALIKPSFDVVSADEAGMLVAAGKAQPSAAVLLQNGAQTLGETKADANGEWVLTPEHALPPGAYKLSLLSVHPKTQERVPGEHSFALTIAPRRKEAPGSGQTLAARPPGAVTSAPAAAPVATRGQPKRPGKLADVKRGDTLWAIAHHFYGNGLRYNEIAGANKEQIKDPNLIFPKQQLAVPDDKR
ncbi:MAG: LysM peptidoglycan-binding domain-containing protein [Rhodomicrobium sp.]